MTSPLKIEIVYCTIRLTERKRDGSQGRLSKFQAQYDRPDSTHSRGKFHYTTGLQFDWSGFSSFSWIQKFQYKQITLPINLEMEKLQERERK